MFKALLCVLLVGFDFKAFRRCDLSGFGGSNEVFYAVLGGFRRGPILNGWKGYEQL